MLAEAWSQIVNTFPPNRGTRKVSVKKSPQRVARLCNPGYASTRSALAGEQPIPEESGTVPV